MDLHHKLQDASPAPTHCSELEYLIELQSEEICGSQPRRSQRLREKEQAILEARKEISENRKKNAINNDGAGSPQLFVETDEEFSQLPPNQATKTDTDLNQVPQNVESKLSNNETPVDEGPKQKRRRKSLSKDKNRSRPRKRTEFIRKQYFYNSQAIVIPSDSNSAPQEFNTSPIKQENPSKTPQVQNPQITESSVQFWYQSKQKSRSCTSSVSGTKRRRPKKQPEAVPTSALGNVQSPRDHPGMSAQHSYQQPTISPPVPTKPHQPMSTRGPQVPPGISWQHSYQQPNVNPRVPTKPHQPMSTHGNLDGPQVPPGISCQHSYRKPGSTVTINPPEPKPSALITNTTQTCAYQRVNLTQTLLPERYPAHFIHQLPPESTTTNGVILSSEMQRIGSGTAVRDSSRDPPTTELRQMCPTPDTTPTVAHESFSPSPPIAESMNSTSPSLSDSLAEIFGTRKIRNILNIEPPRKYLVLEVHLPAIAFMLNVELGRLRAVLGMTQRLTLDQVQEMTQKSRDVISIHSSSEADHNEEMQ
ncbi:hypothetical protein ACLKA6_011744 [Drosophila palustris]